MTVDVALAAGGGATAVRVVVSDVAVELAESTKAVWAWAGVRLGDDPASPALPPWGL